MERIVGQLFEKCKALHLDFVLILTLINWSRNSSSAVGQGQIDEYIEEKRTFDGIFKGLEIERMSEIFFRVMGHAQQPSVLIFSTLKYLWVQLNEDLMMTVLGVYSTLLTRDQGSYVRYIVLFLCRIFNKSLAFKMEISHTKLNISVQYRANFKAIIEDVVQAQGY